MRKHFLITLFISWIFAAGLYSGCTPPPDHIVNIEESKPAQLMKEGNELFNDQYYDDAIEAFQNIRDRYPYSKFVVAAELKIADCFYMKKHYDEAYAAYFEFERFHPNSPKLPYIIYQKAMCHYERVDTIDRDQFYTSAAKQEFDRLVKRFPETEYAKKSIWKTRRCYINLAGKELYVGNFYFKMKKYKAARARYLYALEHFPDLGQYQEALEYLAQCEKILGAKKSDEIKLTKVSDTLTCKDKLLEKKNDP